MNTERKDKNGKPVPSRKEKKSILQRLTIYLVSVRNELKRVSWPTRKAIINSTITVIIFVLFWSIYIGLWDYLFAYIMNSMVTR